MTAPVAILTQGTTISFNDKVIGGVVSITGIGSGSATEIPVTTLASPAKEFLQGLQDFGSFSMELIRVQGDEGQDEMQTAKAAQATYEVVITLADSSVATFDAFVQELSTEIKADGAVMGTAKLRVTGDISWT